MTSPSVKILWALGSAAVLSAAALSVLTGVQAALVGVVTLLVVLWTNEGLPLGVVSLLPIVLFPALHILPPKATTVYYAHPIIYLFLGGYMLA
ncbi:MAG: anion transporter, partial [Campylobacterales bacterium]